MSSSENSAKGVDVAEQRQRQRQSIRHHIASHFSQTLQPSFPFEATLLLLSLCAGINDVATFADYGVFTSNQTGNTALLAVGALSLTSQPCKEPPDLRLIGISLGLFVAGGFIFGQVGSHLGSMRRSWLVTSNVFQTVLVFIVAALRHWYAGSNLDSPRPLSVVGMLAFAMSGQVSMARTSGIAEIPTVVLTSAYIDFTSDKRFLVLDNRPRNRRVGFIAFFILGAFVGGIVYRWSGAPLALLICAVLKTIACLSLLLQPGKTPILNLATPPVGKLPV